MGKPTIMIEHGKLIYESFNKVRYDINDLLEQCRINGYYDISDIEYAIVEANGELSILPNEKNRPVTTKDMNLNVKKDTVKKLVDYNLNNWLKGFYVCGNTGECVVLPSKTRIELLYFME